MVSKADKIKMKSFVEARLEDSGRYDIKKSDESHILVATKRENAERIIPIDLLLHNRKMPLTELRDLVRNSYSSNILVSNIFYKDGQNFMVRLGSRGNFKGDDRSLKRYTKSDLDKMIHLRGLEKEVLELQNDNTLVYFQPKTDRLIESVRGYQMRDVILDYSHVDRDHRSFGFVEDRSSIDYKIAEEDGCFLNQSLAFGISKSRKLAILKPF